MSTESPKRPNILFIMTDQHRHDFLGCRGADFLDTPNIDRIAERGTIFTQCITSNPICAPARAALASGRYSSTIGCVHNNCFLPNRVPTYYQQLRDHGYRVACVGKLDLAKPDHALGLQGNRPQTYTWGFTDPHETEGKMNAGMSPEPFGPYTQYLHEKGKLKAFYEDYRNRGMKGWAVGEGAKDSVLDAEDWADAYIGRKAAEWIEKAPSDEPWHMFVSFVGPHDPFDPPKEYADRYRDRPMPPPVPEQWEGKADWPIRMGLHKGASPEQIEEARRQYCASTTAIDDEVGRILKVLEDRGELDSTLIVFSSDHGESLGDHGLFTKQTPNESSIRIPLIIAGPGIPSGAVRDDLINLIDLNPTICEWAGSPALPGIHARSICSLFENRDAKHRDALYFEDVRYQGIRDHRWKYIRTMDDITELYDLESDPDEQVNVADQHPELCSKYRHLIMHIPMENKWE